jgi:hypothetical protein
MVRQNLRSQKYPIFSLSCRNSETLITLRLNFNQVAMEGTGLNHVGQPLTGQLVALDSYDPPVLDPGQQTSGVGTILCAKGALSHSWSSSAL